MELVVRLHSLNAITLTVPSSILLAIHLSSLPLTPPLITAQLVTRAADPSVRSKEWVIAEGLDRSNQRRPKLPACDDKRDEEK